MRGAQAGPRFGGDTMGSTWSAKLAGPGIPPDSAAAARQAIEAAFADVVAKMSTYDDASELSRFNRHASRAPFALSDDTFAVFARAQKSARRRRARSTSPSRRRSTPGASGRRRRSAS